MVLDRTTPTQRIEIWHPRWHDRRVLIAKYRLGTHNEVRFTGGPKKKLPDSLKDKAFYISGKQAQEYPLETNGTVACYAIPLDELELLERR